MTPFIQGKSRMREIRSYGSVRGVLGNRHPYRDLSRSGRAGDRPFLGEAAPKLGLFLPKRIVTTVSQSVKYPAKK